MAYTRDAQGKIVKKPLLGFRWGRNEPPPQPPPQLQQPVYEQKRWTEEDWEQNHLVLLENQHIIYQELNGIKEELTSGLLEELRSIADRLDRVEDLLRKEHKKPGRPRKDDDD